jgi:hypothetical protein
LHFGIKRQKKKLEPTEEFSWENNRLLWHFSKKQDEFKFSKNLLFVTVNGVGICVYIHVHVLRPSASPSPPPKKTTNILDVTCVSILHIITQN